MTAHAMTGDREKSLTAGMNDHVTKPIDPSQLFTTLTKWIRRPAAAEAQAGETRAETAALPAEPALEGTLQAAEDSLPQSLPGFDLQAGLRRLGGNRNLYGKLLQNFTTEYQGTAAEIRQALRAEDLKRVHALVPNLKGLAGNLSATTLFAAAVDMETLTKQAAAGAVVSQEALDATFAALENALVQALASAGRVEPDRPKSAADLASEPSMPSELARKVSERLRAAAELGNITELKAIARELAPTHSGVSDRLVQLAEEFDFDGILHLAATLSA
jgi:HPt (histidine-containing phosphotransfer) domain-containing protein